MIDSLNRHCENFKIAVLCLDDVCYNILSSLNISNIITVRIQELEKRYPMLLTVKENRTRLEYYFTCGPSFIHYSLNLFIDCDLITYLDSDLYFYNSPKPLFDGFKNYSIGVVGHHLPDYRRETRQGIYNVGWLNFRRDDEGMACLDLWQRQCIEWCYDKLENGKYADQLYLDEWPNLYSRFYEFTHHGANVAPWNVGDYDISLHDGQVYINNDPLIFYHYHGFKKVTSHIYNTNLWLNFKSPHPILKKYVFTEYIQKLEFFSSGKNPTESIRSYKSKFHFFKLFYKCLIGILFRQFIVVYRNRIF